MISAQKIWTGLADLVTLVWENLRSHGGMLRAQHNESLNGGTLIQMTSHLVILRTGEIDAH